VFSNLFVLGQGDGFSSGNSFRYNFYYKNANSTGNSVPDTKKLLSVLIKSLNSIEKPKGRVFLMLSSGKDSVAIAIALSMSNLKDSTTCLTFTNDKPNEESVIASEICNRLGLRHKAVSIDINNKSFSDTLRKGISNFTLPSLDLVTIPYLKCVLENVGKGDLLLDGSGNDVYVGHVPPKWQKQWDTFINRTEYLGRYARNVVHPRTKLAKLFRTRSEFCFAGKYLSFQEAKKIYKETNDVRGYWRDSDKNYNNMDLFDFRAVIRGRHPDQELLCVK
jgi:asparagine synthase (glutamine-hydrolysing)